jgi:hypothetical protein
LALFAAAILAPMTMLCARRNATTASSTAA